MKISSPQISLSTSLSCRLKSSGSLKGGQASPMFPTGGKKRGSGFENPEPSSPKVTCIGQVRVKTKKQGKKMRARSVKRRSFRKSESRSSSNLVRQSSNGGNGFQAQRNQRWVHLPFTICEAVRAFGSELNCFLPCNSSCSSNKEESKPAERSSESSCGTVFGRWVVVGEEECQTEKENGSRRRHVFEGMDFKGENEEESRISICIPPKNALLLMRCRSDPVKMEVLAKRFCESPATKLEEEEERKVEINVKTEEQMSEESVSYAIDEKEEAENPIEMATENEIDVQKLGITVVNHQSREEQEENRVQEEELTEETMEIPIPIPIQTHCESEMAEDAEKLKSVEEDESKPAHGNEQDPETEEDENQRKELEKEEESESGENPTSPSLSETEFDGNWEEEEEEVKETTTKATDEGIEPDIQNDDEMGPEEETDQSKERETPPEPERETKPEASVLPECLLLMMYEPKLSMEVSKETWVCTTDFTRCVPTREKKAALPLPPPPKKKPAISIAQAAVQPGRWSCSFPAAAAAAAMIEQKLARAKGGYEPFVLTRCKSEPMRSAANLAPDACFWKDRKLEPHPPATFGVGAAGVGF